jgi:hypothetical protein
MHIDDNKKFDKRNIERNIKNGLITPKDFEIYLSKLPDVTSKLFNPEVSLVDSGQVEPKKEAEVQHKRKVAKKKPRGKGK